jgi:hypothetical protein
MLGAGAFLAIDIAVTSIHIPVPLVLCPPKSHPTSADDLHGNLNIFRADPAVPYLGSQFEGWLKM